MSNPTHDAAALLWQQRQDGTVIDELPPALRPADKAGGHAIQAQLPAVAGRRVVGWKIAATAEAGQKHINVSGPLAGRILAGTVFELGATVSLTGNRMRVVEPEFAFSFATALAPRATPRTQDEVMATVAAVHAAFEVPDSRYRVFTQVGEAQLIADNACCGPFAFGSAVPAGRTLDLAAHAVHAVVTGADGQVRYTRDGAGRAALGDPRHALTWLVNELSSLGVALEAGALVSTGTCMVPLEVQPGDHVMADFGVLGRIEMRLAP